MQYKRMPIEIESPESLGYDSIECNLAESSVRDIKYKDLGIDLNQLVLAYDNHIGKPALRKLIAQEHAGISEKDVLLTVGAAGALFIINTSLLTKEDHLIVVCPNYATNIETPRAIGCDISFIDLSFEEQYALDLEKIKSALRPNTKLISITTPHNPTGTIVEKKILENLCKLAEDQGCYLLVDETYRDIAFHNVTALAATVSHKAISVSSVSKAYGIPGIRLGWVISRDPLLQEVFLAAKEQIHICNSIIDEEIGYQTLLKKETYFPKIKEEVMANFALLKNWMQTHQYLEWIEPSGGVVCFPRFKKIVNIDIEAFYKTLLKKHRTYVGPGHWFEQSKRSFRLGFGWEQQTSFIRGLANIDKAILETLL
ncbi:MAG: pyridoxal phosphate-dependent aminotransferase [Bacteroidetes bacterium]|nr:pyridoxal phosphate-dependent aminotransferase [Bacteroidota bacterium]